MLVLSLSRPDALAEGGVRAGDVVFVVRRGWLKDMVMVIVEPQDWDLISLVESSNVCGRLGSGVSHKTFLTRFVPIRKRPNREEQFDQRLLYLDDSSMGSDPHDLRGVCWGDRTVKSEERTRLDGGVRGGVVEGIAGEDSYMAWRLDGKEIV